MVYSFGENGPRIQYFYHENMTATSSLLGEGGGLLEGVRGGTLGPSFFGRDNPTNYINEAKGAQHIFLKGVIWSLRIEIID